MRCVRAGRRAGRACPEKQSRRSPHRACARKETREQNLGRLPHWVRRPAPVQESPRLWQQRPARSTRVCSGFLSSRREALYTTLISHCATNTPVGAASGSRVANKGLFGGNSPICARSATFPGHSRCKQRSVCRNQGFTFLLSLSASVSTILSIRSPCRILRNWRLSCLGRVSPESSSSAWSSCFASITWVVLGR